ncbi:transcriptional regulator, XRE family [Desulfofarcimen acetoxidans DSM 771]|uniref:Transcriptional regulator, XRE family n=1 Tax=Desulfofarcimen acetoxidans (strain ATCC 49208 / DSM 771 / KCTC 5769 / VKM B-1644 / 5575) TaxID=485916 RepID=C8VXW1_DESAS|nr:helix-turn-helix transcriptional regulator [Desulfofarcimen acetoxidans]ACV64590.1 transcriptional regulator, XRE family [Desulfofarcimen acetoxidans DSM 771]
MPLKFTVRLKQILFERGMTQKELVELTGLRPAAISEFANNRRSVINTEHLVRVAEALNIKDISELIRFEEVKQ